MPYKQILTQNSLICLDFLVFRRKWSNSFLSEEVANKNTTNLRDKHFITYKANEVRSDKLYTKFRYLCIIPQTILQLLDTYINIFCTVFNIP